jgi:hypothetical protein
MGVTAQSGVQCLPGFCKILLEDFDAVLLTVPQMYVDGKIIPSVACSGPFFALSQLSQ